MYENILLLVLEGLIKQLHQLYARYKMEEIYIKISMKGQGQSPVSPGKREFKFGRMTKCSFLYTWFLQMQSLS